MRTDRGTDRGTVHGSRHGTVTARIAARHGTKKPKAVRALGFDSFMVTI